jgi:hypothetical protein
VQSSSIFAATDCAIAMFDVTCPFSYMNMCDGIVFLIHACGENIPIALVANTSNIGAAEWCKKTVTEKFARKYGHLKNIIVKIPLN